MKELEHWLTERCGPQAFMVLSARPRPNGVLAVYQLIEYQAVFLLLLVV